MKRIHILPIIILALAVEGLAAYVPPEQEKTFTSDSVIQEGDLYERVLVYDTPPDHTTVNMTGGGVLSIVTYDGSEVNITGGTVGDMSGGAYSHQTHGTSMINVYEGGSFVGGSLAELTLFDSSTLNIYGARVDVLVGPGESSVVNAFGGYMLHIGASDNGHVNVHGGTIDSFRTNTYIADTATTSLMTRTTVGTKLDGG